MGRMWRGGYRRFHPIGDRMGNEMVDVFDVGQPICDLDMEYGIYKVPAKEVIPYRIYPVLSPAWKADGYDELGIIYDRYLDLLVTYVVEGESETDGYAAAIVTFFQIFTCLYRTRQIPELLQSPELFLRSRCLFLDLVSHTLCDLSWCVIYHKCPDFLNLLPHLPAQVHPWKSHPMRHSERSLPFHLWKKGKRLSPYRTD